MFILKSTHTELLRVLELSQAQERAMVFNQIEQLKSQIADLKRLVFLPKIEPDPVALEADAVISASEKAPEMSEEERTRILEGERELDLLLSGAYDESLLN